MSMSRLGLARILVFSVLATAIAVLVHAKTLTPGNEPYTPTRLEWAALELQATHGDTWSPEGSTVMVSYRPGQDGLTIVCVLQYSADTSASLIGIVRDTTRQVFSIYKDAKGWAWLRLDVKNQVLGG